MRDAAGAASNDSQDNHPDHHSGRAERLADDRCGQISAKVSEPALDDRGRPSEAARTGANKACSSTA